MSDLRGSNSSGTALEEAWLHEDEESLTQLAAVLGCPVTAHFPSGLSTLSSSLPHADPLLLVWPRTVCSLSQWESCEFWKQEMKTVEPLCG